MYYYGYRESRIAEDKKKSRREKRQERKILLEDENDGEWNRKQQLNNWEFSCTAKNSRTTWVRGCRGTSWKTWGRKTVAAQIQLNTKCMVRQNTVARIESRKTAGSLPLIYYVMCLTFYLKIFPWIKCIMFSPVVILCIHLR